MRDIYRLFGEMRELGADGAAWRTHAARELLRLTDAVVGMSIEAYQWSPGAPPAVGAMIDVGWRGDAERKIFYDFLSNPAAMAKDVSIMALARLAPRDHIVTREVINSDSEWYGCETTADGRLPSGIDHYMLSSRVLTHEGRACGTDQLVIHRPPGGQPFLKRHRQMLTILHDELAALWRRPPRPSPGGEMPRYLRRVLERLQSGRSEKEVAQDLRLSAHTVHGYVNELHRRLGVSTRAEMLARFGQAYDFTPRLSGPPPAGR